MRLGMFAGLASVAALGLGLSRPGDDPFDDERDAEAQRRRDAHRATWQGKAASPRRYFGNTLRRDHKQERAIARRLFGEVKP